MPDGMTTKANIIKQKQHQPFYYHIDDISNTLKDKLIISVTLKKIIQENKEKRHTSIIINQGNNNNDNEALLQNKQRDNNNESPPSPLDINCDIAWQEKIHGPNEDFFLLDHNKSGIMSNSEDNIGEKNNNGNYNSNDNGATNTDTASCLDMNQTNMRIFTYTHKDIYTTNPYHPDNDNKRCKNTLELKNGNKGIIPYRIMYIMAAVDCHNEGTSAHKYYDPNNNNLKPHLDYHEQLLCQMKAYDNGALEVTPGFSVEEKEEEVDNCFRPRSSFIQRNSKINIKNQKTTMKQQQSSKLTTFRFSSKQGNVFEYTICNKNSIKDINDIERISNEESYVDQCIVSERSQYYKLLSSHASSLLNDNRSSRPPLVAVSIEIMSIENFDVQSNIIGEQSYIYINHDISSLPKGWKHISSDEICMSNDSKDYDSIQKLRGCSSCTKTPLAILPSTYLFQEFRVDEIHIIIALTIPMALVLIIFHESIIAKTIWIIPLVISLIGVGGSPHQRKRSDKSQTDVCHFNHPINLYLQPLHHDAKSEKEDDDKEVHAIRTSNNASITIAFEVCSQKASGFFTIEGYAFLNISLLSVNEGVHIHNVKTWKNKGGRGGGIFSNIRKNMHEYYLGGSSRSSSALASSTSAMSPDFNKVFQLYKQKTSKLGYITESHGDLLLRVNITRERSTSTVNKNQRNSNDSSDISDFTNDVDSVLSRVRKNRTERKIREIAKTKESDSDALSSLLNITTSNNYAPAISSTTIASTITANTKNSINIDSNNTKITNNGNDFGYEMTGNDMINSSRVNSTVTNTSSKNPRTEEILSRIKTRKEARKKNSMLPKI